MSNFRNSQNRKECKYKCLKCGYEGNKSEHLIEKGVGCPCCANRVIVKGINDIPTTDPWMIPYFQGGKLEASLYSKSSSKKIIPKCPDCGRIVAKQTINMIYTHKGVSCVCQDGVSFPNKIIYFVMEQLFKNNKIRDFTREYYVQEDNKYFDIYFTTNSNKHFFVEMDGGVGHGDIILKHKLRKSESEFVPYPSSLFKNDICKEKIAKRMGIELIRIDCYYSDFEYIKNNLLASELVNIVDLSIIDWKEVERESHGNLMKAVCLYRKENPQVFVKDAVEKFNLSAETIRKYWTRGNELGWCDFTRKSESVRSRNARKYYGQSRPVEMINIKTRDGVRFESVSDFVKNNIKYFKNPLSKKIAEKKFKQGNEVIRNYENYDIYKLRRNCDGIRKSS